MALHRFLYDHWDHVRQTLVSRERREYVRSPGELSRGRSPTLEPLRNLIANLGPPPLAVSWNRPGISTNSPPLYSRFQNFMLRNAFKSTESFLTARAVYDGGESKVSNFIPKILTTQVINDPSGRTLNHLRDSTQHRSRRNRLRYSSLLLSQGGRLILSRRAVLRRHRFIALPFQANFVCP